MGPLKDKSPREAIEVAYYTKELGRPLQRKMLQRQLDDFADSGAQSAGHHGERADTAGAEPEAPTPRDDRAG